MVLPKMYQHASKSTMVVLLTLSALARAEVFSSGGNMKEIFRFELDLLTGLEGYIENLEKRINNIDAYLDDFKKASSHLKPDDEPSDLDLGNPITSFNTVKRLSVFYKKVEDDLSDEPTSNFNRTLRMARRRSVVSPAESDLHGLAKALLRIQDVYQVEVPDLAKGKFASTGVLIETNATLTAQDCWYIGKHCYQEQKLSHSLEWFQQAVNLAEEEGNRTLPVKVAKDYLNMVAKEHDEQFWNPWGLKDKIFPKEFTKEPDVFEQRRKLNRDRENSTWAKSEYKIAHNGTLTPQTVLDTDIFNALCRGVEFRSPAHLAKLNCYLSYRNDPYYILAPVRIEVAHDEPEILIFRDIVTPTAMKLIQDIASPLLIRAQVGEHRVAEVSKSRISMSTWIQDSVHPVAVSLSEQISHLTGLKTKSLGHPRDAETLQVGNYLNAGLYDSHFDHLRKPDKYGSLRSDLDDRIATWMFYLNTVETGGRTVFPLLGAAVKPEAGSAVFWYNLKKSLWPDQRTLHGACPLLFGSKWVANKWIRETNQWDRRPCGLTIDN